MAPRAAPPAPSSTTVLPSRRRRCVSRRTSARPKASVLRPSILPSRKTSRLAAPAAWPPHRTLCASAKAASLCGTVTLTPAKPGAAHAVDHRGEIFRPRRQRHHRAVDAIFLQPVAMQHRRQRMATGQPMTRPAWLFPSLMTPARLPCAARPAPAAAAGPGPKNNRPRLYRKAAPRAPQNDSSPPRTGSPAPSAAR